MSLASKLADVMKAVQRIPKHGRNNFHNYDYATEADIVEAIRGELADRQVMLVPSVTGHSREPIGEKGSVLTLLPMEMEFIDGESNERIVKPWLGCGSDKDDKGIYKAMTGAEKYFLLKTFLIPTGDDPERDDKAQLKERDKATAKPDKATRKARVAPPIESGATFVEKVIPKSSGNTEWADVIFATGETLIARQPQLISLCTELAQGTQAVVVETHQNGKGKTELDMVRRWPVRDEAEENRILDASLVAL